MFAILLPSGAYPAVVTRLFNVIGPGETNPHILPEIIAQLKTGHSTLQLGNLTPKRDYIDVNDAADGFATVALCSHIHPGEVVTVNLGTQNAYSVTELLVALRQITAIDFQVQTDNARLRKSDRPDLNRRPHKNRSLIQLAATDTVNCYLAGKLG